ncbi:hypothetical protein D9M71_481070 [compost metagenome]
MSLTAVLFSTMVGFMDGNERPAVPSQEKIEFRGPSAMSQCRSFENAIHTKTPTLYGIRKVSVDSYGTGKVQRETYCVQTEQ